MIFLSLNLSSETTSKKKKQFDDDVYIATSESHGTIEATVTRGSRAEPHVKLWASSLSKL